ncbi:MAG: hypothetical protein QXO78_01395 [Desulfurococcaceae archaeon]
MSSRSITISIDVTRSPRVTLELNNASEFLKCIESEGYSPLDLYETKTILENFDEYFRLAKKKFQDYIVPARDPKEVVEGKSIVHKVRLIVENSSKMVEFVLDRRVDLEKIKNCLLKIGFNEIVIIESL